MKISYAITVCNELNEIKNLIGFLLEHKREEDEIAVLQDIKRQDENTYLVGEYLRELYRANKISFRWDNFREDFAEWKNELNELCTGDYIFQIDADECPNENMMKYLPALLESNSTVDLFLVSRNNTVEGLTQEDIDRWHWSISMSSSGKQLINWPDWQTRIYKKGLQWQGKVHERIVGFKKYAQVPTTLYLNHDKNIQKQREQNALYDKILSNG